MKTYIELANIGIEKTSDVIKSITDNSKFDEVKYELCYHLIAVIHLTGDIYGRLAAEKKFDSLANEDKEYMLAFEYINNQVKHDDALNMVYYEVCNSTFPLRFPMRFSKYPGICWKDFKNREDPRRKIKLRPFYDSCLNGKDVLMTLRKLTLLLSRISEREV